MGVNKQEGKKPPRRGRESAGWGRESAGWGREPARQGREPARQGREPAGRGGRANLEAVLQIMEVEDSLWAATTNGLVEIYDIEGKGYRFYEQEKVNGVLPVENATEILAYSKGVFWYTYRGGEGGISAFSIKDKKFTNFGAKDGIPQSAQNLIFDNEGRLWITSGEGLFVLTPGEGRAIAGIRKYSLIDGIQNRSYNKFAVFKNREGVLYFGGSNGFNRVDPADLAEIAKIPVMKLDFFKVNEKEKEFDQDLNSVESVTLPYDENHLFIGYYSLNFINRDFIRYQYRLKGVDSTWVDNGGSLSVRYPKLKKGRYVFEVRSTDSLGRWSENAKSIAVTILPPLWQSVWAYLAYVVIILLTAVFAYRKVSRDIKRKMDMKMLRYEVAFSKINTHFLFNTLSTIGNIAASSPAKARQMTIKLAETVRYILRFKVENLTKLQEDLHIVESYLFLEEVQMGQRLQWEFDIDDLVKDFKIPQLVLQPIVENSIKYSISPAEQGGIVSIKAEESKPAGLLLTISDRRHQSGGRAGYTGVRGGSGIALDNIKKRLSMTYGNKVDLNMNITEEGCAVRMNIPYESKA
ncbi:MAG: hypothetical protein GY757_27205 [bacterium]|nr:hypothetical protein [bacterium]